MRFVIEEFTQVTRGTLLGFARVRTAKLIWHDVGVHQSGDNYWAMPSSKAMIGRDGTVIKDVATGRARYTPVVSFASRELRDRFSSGVVEALRMSHPGVFDGGAS